MSLADISTHQWIKKMTSYNRVDINKERLEEIKTKGVLTYTELSPKKDKETGLYSLIIFLDNLNFNKYKHLEETKT